MSLAMWKFLGTGNLKITCALNRVGPSQGTTDSGIKPPVCFGCPTRPTGLTARHSVFQMTIGIPFQRTNYMGHKLIYIIEFTTLSQRSRALRMISNWQECQSLAPRVRPPPANGIDEWSLTFYRYHPSRSGSGPPPLQLAQNKKTMMPSLVLGQFPPLVTGMGSVSF